MDSSNTKVVQLLKETQRKNGERAWAEEDKDSLDESEGDTSISLRDKKDERGIKLSKEK